jgi:hypothetical protein
LGSAVHIQLPNTAPGLATTGSLLSDDDVEEESVLADAAVLPPAGGAAEEEGSMVLRLSDDVSVGESDLRLTTNWPSRYTILDATVAGVAGVDVEGVAAVVAPADGVRNIEGWDDADDDVVVSTGNVVAALLAGESRSKSRSRSKSKSSSSDSFAFFFFSLFGAAAFVALLVTPFGDAGALVEFSGMVVGRGTFFCDPPPLNKFRADPANADNAPKPAAVKLARRGIDAFGDDGDDTDDNDDVVMAAVDVGTTSRVRSLVGAVPSACYQPQYYQH